MIANTIPIDKLEEWQRDLKRIVHEIHALPSEEDPSYWDCKIDDTLIHLQTARTILAMIAHDIEAETGQKVKTYPDYSSSQELDTEPATLRVFGSNSR